MTTRRKSSLANRRQQLALQKTEIQALLMKGMRDLTPLLGVEKFNRDAFVNGMTSVGTDLLVLAHLTGQKRSLIQAKKASGLKLSALADALDVMSKRAGAKLGVLRAQYRLPALRMANDISVGVQRKLLVAQTKAIGLSVEEGSRVIQEAYDASGVTIRNSYMAENTFRTQTSIAYHAGKWQTEQEPVIQEALWGYTYFTVGDDRVREEHESLDGTSLPKEDTFWKRYYPPNGWSCRCTVVAEYSEASVKEAPEELPDDSPDFQINFGEVLKFI